MNILVTAIGSMSADCVIQSLKNLNCFVVGCDIYPAKWHAASNDCDLVFQSPLALNEPDYIQFLMDISTQHNINYIFPLTDVEVDVINKHRNEFEKKGIIICLSPFETINIVRNKFDLHKRFLNDPMVPSIKTYRSKSDHIASPIFPYIAKPCDGRSSEGLIYISTEQELSILFNQDNYIIQEYKEGNIYAVDYIRNNDSGSDYSIVREELLRTRNGAGTTVHMTNNSTLSSLTSYIGNSLNINGCVNMEFIKSDDSYYLIDINPRFSAGIAFTHISGYDIVKSHLNCFTHQEILDPVEIPDIIVTKRYIELVLSK